MTGNGFYMDLLLNEQELLNEIFQQSDDNSIDHDEMQIRKKGVKNGSKRGKYERSTDAVRARVIAAADIGDDWVAVAAANGVKQSTAYNWNCCTEETWWCRPRESETAATARGGPHRHVERESIADVERKG